MAKNKVYILLSLILLIASCKPLGDLTKTGDAYCAGAKNPDGTCKNGANKPAKMSTVSLQNDQIVLTGENLTGVTSVKITGPSGFNEALSISSKTGDKLIASGLRAISFTVGAVFSLIIEDANGATTYPITFTLKDGSVTANKLHNMGAGVGQILKFNGTNWVPSDLGGLTYAGNWDANTNNPDLTGVGTSGEYYIVTTAGATDLSGGFGTDSWSVGDWAVWNDVLNQWEKIDNATNVTSFNGRNGAVTPQANDYTWAQINKTTSSINDIADVDTTGAASGKVLKFDGTKWVIGDDNSGGVSSDSVSSSSIIDGSIVNADISSSAAIAQSKVSNLTTDLAAKLSLSGGTMTGNLTMGSNDIITSGTVDGVDVSTLNTTVSGNTTAISGKEPTITAGTTSQYFRGDKSWQTLNADAVDDSSTSHKFVTSSQLTQISTNSTKVSASGSIHTHSDVDTSTTSPSVGDKLEWDGTNWVPNTSFFISVGGNDSKSFSNSFTTYVHPIVLEGNPAHYNSSTGIVTLPTSGVYLIQGTMRSADGSPANRQWGVGVHTSNSDGGHFLWHMVQDTAAVQRRTTYPYTRMGRFNAGDQLRMFIYVDGGAINMRMGQMNIYKLSN